jgi:hypothetical protein
METNETAVVSQHIPVTQAEHIARCYNKDVVVVFAWARDHGNDLIAISYGSDEMAMFKAEDWLTRCSALLGADLRSAVFYERPSAVTEMEAKLKFLSRKLGEIITSSRDKVSYDIAVSALAEVSKVVK